MDWIPESLRSMFGDPQSLTFSVLVFAVVFTAVATAGLHFSKPPKILDGNAFPKSRWRATSSPREGSASDPAPAAHSPDPFASFKKRLLVGYRVLSFILVASLAALTVGSWFVTSPHDGSRLVPIILGFGTLMLALHALSIDRRHRPTSDEVALSTGPAHDLRTELASKVGAALLAGAKIDWQIASPQVYSIDQETLDRASALAADKTPIDEICRTIAPEYDLWGSAHQQAYQAVVQAAIEHRG